MFDNPRDGRDGDVLAVVSQSGPTVTFFDARTDVPLGALELLAEPHELCFDPKHRLLWCTNTYFGGYYHANAGRRTQLTVIDPDARRIVEVIDLAPEHGPHGLALDPIHGRVYVSVEGSNDRPGGVVVIDLETRKSLGRIDTQAPGPHWFVIDPAGLRGYASNKEAPFVSIVDLQAGTMVAAVEVPGSEGLAVSADGGELYVAAPYAAAAPEAIGERAAPGVRVIDTEAARVVDVLATEYTAIPVHLTNTGILLAGQPTTALDGSTGFGRQGPGRLSAFAAATRTHVGEVTLTGELPLTITASPDGRLGYVAAVASSTVDVVDLQTWKVLATLRVSKRGEPGAHGLAYIPRPVE
jgi:DNA-binding beta-propeller fold protein YncE